MSTDWPVMASTTSSTIFKNLRCLCCLRANRSFRAQSVEPYGHLNYYAVPGNIDSLSEALSRGESAIRRQKPRGFHFLLIRISPMPSGLTGSVACTENLLTGYLRIAKGSHVGRRAFCDGTSNLQPCAPGSARLAGTRFDIPTRACYVEWVLTSKSNKNCSGTRPFKAR